MKMRQMSEEISSAALMETILGTTERRGLSKAYLRTPVHQSLITSTLDQSEYAIEV